MTKRDFAFVGCKLLGLYFIANCLCNVQYWTPLLGAVFFRGRHMGEHPSNAAFMALYGLLPFVVPMIFAYIFWFRADAIARSIAPDEPAKT